MSEHLATPADLDALLQFAKIAFRSQPERLRRLRGDLDPLLARRRAGRIVFKPSDRSPAAWRVGTPGAERVMHCNLSCLWGAYLAIKGRHDGVNVSASECSPGTAYPGNSFRTGLKRAIERAEDEGLPELASVLRCITVGADDIVRYKPLRSTPQVDTD